MEYPKITLGMVNSRNNHYPQEAIESMRRTLYPLWEEKININILQNLNKELTIGKAFNRLAQDAKGEWIMYIGDDDKIARTMLFNYAVYLLTNAESNPDKEVVCVTGNIILFDDKKEKRQHLQSSPTGMWNVEYLKNNPFDETLERYVDTEMFARTLNENKKTILYAATDYGYYYRQHANNVSGNKFTSKTKILKEIIQRNEEQQILGGIVG